MSGSGKISALSPTDRNWPVRDSRLKVPSDSKAVVRGPLVVVRGHSPSAIPFVRGLIVRTLPLVRGFIVRVRGSIAIKQQVRFKRTCDTETTTPPKRGCLQSEVRGA